MNPNMYCVVRDTPDPPDEEARRTLMGEPERTAMLEELKEQIRRGVYRADVRDLARSLASMMVRQL